MYIFSQEHFLRQQKTPQVNEGFNAIPVNFQVNSIMLCFKTTAGLVPKSP